MAKMLETDLYKPVKQYFEGLGYTVNAEIKGCDVTAYKEDRLIIIELKTHFNMKLLYQALDRQKISNEVFVAIPKPKQRKNNLSKMILICQHLNLGLIVISSTKLLEVVVESHFPAKQKNNVRSRGIIQEINGRSMDNNIGGSTRKKIITAYTEKALYIAYVLSQKGQMKPSILVKTHGCATETRTILYNNYYGWFNRIGLGCYELSPKGRTELFQPQYAAYLRKFQEVTYE